MFSITSFHGIRPKLSPLLLGTGHATDALDCDLRDGKLVPLLRPTAIANAPGGKDGLLVKPDGSVEAFDHPVHQARVGNRTVFTTEEETSTVRYKHMNDDENYRLGMPRPATAPTAVVANVGSGTEPVNDELFSYAYKNRRGDIGYPSAHSEAAQVRHTGSVTLSGFAAIPAGEGWDTTNARIVIYQNSTEGRRQPVAEIDAATAETTLVLADLNPAFPILHYSGDTVPPVGLQNLREHPNRFWVGFLGDKLRFSEVGNVAVWPPEYSLTSDAGEIIGLAVHVDRIYLFPKDGPPEVVSLTSPAVLQRSLTSIPYTCVSGASIVDTGAGVLYACNAGIVSMSGTNGVLVTRQHFDRRSFRAYRPDKIRAYEIDGVYTCYGNDRPFKLDILAASEPFDISEQTASPKDVKVVEGIAYGIRDGTIYSYETADTNRNMRWASGLLRLSFPQTFAAFQVRADFAPRPVNGFVGGIGAEAVGSEGVGEPTITKHSLQQAPGVVLEIIDAHDNTLFGPTRVADADSWPLPLAGKLDTFRIRIISETTVESFAMGRTHQELRTVIS